MQGMFRREEARYVFALESAPPQRRFVACQLSLFPVLFNPILQKFLFPGGADSPPPQLSCRQPGPGLAKQAHFEGKIGLAYFRKTKKSRSFKITTLQKEIPNSPINIQK